MGKYDSGLFELLRFYDFHPHAKGLIYKRL